MFFFVSRLSSMIIYEAKENITVKESIVLIQKTKTKKQSLQNLNIAGSKNLF